MAIVPTLFHLLTAYFWETVSIKTTPMCATICHYTTTQVLNSILRKDGVYLWATRYDHLNDPNEQKWTQGAIKPFLMDKYKITECDLTESYSKYPYIISFCAIPDYMNMWRLYCNDGRGIMLEFDYNEIFKKSEKHKRQTNNEDWDMFLGVTYSSLKDLNKKFAIAKRLYSQLYEDCDGIENDLGVCTFIKNEDFDIEDEIRYVRMKENDMFFSKQGECVFKENRDGILYRMRDAELIPYTEIKFSPSAIKKIIVGYKLNFEKTCEGIHAILNQYGDTYEHLNKNIVQSTIGKL